MTDDEFAFDGEERGSTGSKGRTRGSADPCGNCGKPLHEHEKERDYTTGPPGAYSYKYVCE